MTEKIPLRLLDQEVLDELRRDRDDCGEGVSFADVERLGGTRFHASLIKRLRSHGFVIGVRDGVYDLGHREPKLERVERKPEVRKLAHLKVAEDAQLTIDLGPAIPRGPWTEAA